MKVLRVNEITRNCMEHTFASFMINRIHHAPSLTIISYFTRHEGVTVYLQVEKNKKRTWSCEHYFINVGPHSTFHFSQNTYWIKFRTVHVGVTVKRSFQTLLKHIWCGKQEGEDEYEWNSRQNDILIMHLGGSVSDLPGIVKVME